jgi:uncharacterized protein (DUF305 family)
MIMKMAMRRLSIAAAAAGLVFAATTGVFAQSGHEGHHPPGETAPASPAPQAQPEGAGPMQKEGMGCMMGGKDMPMMKMMQEMHGKMMGGSMAMQPKGDTGPSSQAFNGIIAKMHQDMAITFTGNSDVDFVKAMIPHHQSAVDMANVLPATTGSQGGAEGVVKAQDAEISRMKEWLKKQPQ